MADPVEIMEAAICAQANRFGLRYIDLAKAAAVALEAAGWRIVHPEKRSNEMDNASADHFPGSFEHWKDCWRDVIAAAPLYGKG